MIKEAPFEYLFPFSSKHEGTNIQLVVPIVVNIHNSHFKTMK